MRDIDTVLSYYSSAYEQEPNEATEKALTLANAIKQQGVAWHFFPNDLGARTVGLAYQNTYELNIILVDTIDQAIRKTILDDLAAYVTDKVWNRHYRLQSLIDYMDNSQIFKYALSDPYKVSDEGFLIYASPYTRIDIVITLR